MNKKHLCAKWHPNQFRNGQEKGVQTDRPTFLYLYYMSRDSSFNFVTQPVLLLFILASSPSVLMVQFNLLLFIYISFFFFRFIVFIAKVWGVLEEQLVSNNKGAKVSLYFLSSNSSLFRGGGIWHIYIPDMYYVCRLVPWWVPKKIWITT